MSKYGVIFGPYFPVFGPEITPYLGTFQAVDELSKFLKNDTIASFETICAELPHRKFEFELASFKFDSESAVQSKQFCENSGILKFSFKVKQDLNHKLITSE